MEPQPRFLLEVVRFLRKVARAPKALEIVLLARTVPDAPEMTPNAPAIPNSPAMVSNELEVAPISPEPEPDLPSSKLH